jgi:type III pantothenate kinase
MKPDVVVDVGNSRVKWGRCADGAVTLVHTLPSEDSAAWQQQFEQWSLGESTAWAVSGSHPGRRDALAEWLRKRSRAVLLLDSHRQLPLSVWLNHPERVGLDRLLNAVAVTRSWARRRLPAVIADAGSAVTVDWVDEQGNFRGGTISPGLRLMARALHDHTALLPLVEVTEPCPYVPGLATEQAMQAGVYYAVVGGIDTLIGLLRARSPGETHVFLTGGDARLLSPAVDRRAELWPEMTLEGIRLSAEAQP